MDSIQNKGLVFDIRRFSTHDGRGIRTTVFLKGCPLSCVWCQNPEGISLNTRPLYFENKCIHCKTCVAVSKNKGVVIEEGKIKLNIQACEDWENIAYECPAAAIVMDCKEYTVEQVMSEVNKDRAFFNHGGGVTLSGGEPLLQSDFSIKLLKAIKDEGIHTAIETALHVDAGIVEEMLKYTDEIFADFKIFDNVDHKKYVGVFNERIKKNLELILKSEKASAVTVRTPLIPGITADEDNIRSIAGYISDIYPDVKYELLNYNPLAASKYHLIDKQYCFADNPKAYTKEDMAMFGTIAADAGIKNVIIDS